MESQDINIEQIERFLLKNMKAEENAAFELKMKSDANLTKEVNAYRTFFNGAKSLQSTHFQEKLEQWSSEWAESDEEESLLIEAYLNDNLHSDLKPKVEQRINDNTAFANKINTYKNLHTGFNTLSEQSFSEKMQSWNEAASDKNNTKKEAKIRPLFRRLAIAASFLLVFSVGLKQYANQNYTTENMVHTFYSTPQLGNTLGGDNGDALSNLEKEFESAHDALQKKAYAKAAAGFDEVLSTLPSTNLPQDRVDYYQDNSKWNKALALLGTGDSITATKALLSDLAKNANDKFYRTKAQELLSKMNSFWFKISG